MSKKLDNFVDAISDTIKNAPTLYEDALQPTVQEVGKLVARIPRAINAAFSGLDKWMLNREYNVEETKKLLEQKLKDVKPEKIVTPDAYVAIPAIQAISYSMNSKALRNLYANLLAKSMNTDTKNFVHPAFVEIINQLSPLDAAAINELKYLCVSQPLIRIFACKKRPTSNKRMSIHNMTQFGNAKIKIPLFSHYSLPIAGTKATAKQRGFVLQNLNRLGLINIDYREHILEATQYKKLYEHLLNSSLYKTLINQTKKDGLHLQLTDGYTSPTDFGRLFFSVCCEEL